MREGEKHQCVVASHVPPTGDLAHNFGMCYNWELNWRPIGSQAHAQSTELYQLGISTLKRQKYYPTLRLSTSYTLGALLWLIV